jgi:hypothetical protein
MGKRHFVLPSTEEEEPRKRKGRRGGEGESSGY